MVVKIKKKFILGIILILMSELFLFKNVFAICLDGQININSANQNDLEQIIGIGPTYAERIIEGRPFAGINDLLNVKGIGEATLQKIREQNLACIETIIDKENNNQDENQATSTPITSEPPLDNENSQSSSNQSPIAIAGPDIISVIGQLINFDASGSNDIDEDPLTYVWNFGEGNYKEGKIVNYAYSFPGKYIVSLEVSDGIIGSVDTLIVEVYPKSIFISEFMPNPKGKDNASFQLNSREEGEWIEITNTSGRVVDLSAWQIDDEDGGSTPFLIPNNTFIFPNSFLIFTRNVTKISLNNSSDEVRILYPSGEVADKVIYQDPKEGLSAALKENKVFWTEISTPGFKNIIYSKDILSVNSAVQDKIVRIQQKEIKKVTDIQNKTVIANTNHKKQLLNQKNNKFVLNPQIDDLDNLFSIKKVLASEINSENKFQNRNNVLQKEIKADIIRTIQKATKKKLFNNPRLILLFSSLISSGLMALWVVKLKDRF